MRRMVMCATALMAIWLGAIGIAQMKVTTGEDYAKVMRSTAQAFGAARSALPASAFSDAKAQLATAREGFVALEGFWTDKKRDDAIGIVRGVLTQIDTLDQLLAMETPSRADTLAAAKQIQGACAACHKLYREGDNQAGFRFRAGVL